MAYRRVTEEEFKRWAAQNPGAMARIDGQETQVPAPQAQDLGFFGNLARGVTKPIRAVAAMPEYLVQALGAASRGETGIRPGQFSSVFLTPEEEMAWAKDPVKQGVKSSAALGSGLIPAGGGAAQTALGRVGTAAGRGAVAGTMSGFGYSEEGQEAKGALGGGALGGILGGALQGVGEVSKAIKARPQGTGKIVDVLDVDEIAKLPKKTRSGLTKQAKSAGFWDPKVSESQNIQNYLTNRGFAGNTPAETLENLTQEFNRASQLKQEGLDEVGGLSRSYLRQVKDNLDEAIQYKGIGLDSESTKVYNDIVKTLEKGPTGAKDLDNIIMRWNEAGRLAKGAQKTSTAGLYADAARELRNVMRSTSPVYDSALQSLNQILGIEDVGTVSGAAKTAAGGGIDLPLFSGAGFRGADIKTPAISDTISKAQASIGRAQETGVGMGSGLLQSAARVAQPVANVAQRAVPGIVGAGQAMPQRQQEPQLEGLGSILPPQEQGPQIDEMALINAVLNGQISTSEADWLMGILGGSDGKPVKQTETQRDYDMAADALTQAYQALEEGGAGKLATVGGNIAGFFGATSPSSAYRAQLDTATAFLRKALIGAGQSESELKNLNLPKPTDEPAIAKQKIEALIPLLRDRAGGSINMGDTSSTALSSIMPWIAQ